MRFLGHQSRDARVIATSDNTPISNGTTTVYPRSDGVVYHQDAHIHAFETTAVSLGATSFRSAGLHMLGPNAIAKQGGTRTLYRVIADGHVEEADARIAVGFGRSPTTPGTAALGQPITKRVYLSGGSNNLQYDDLLAVDPFPDADKALAICFFIYLFNAGAATVSSVYEFNMSVARLIGPRPMMHDQRIQ